MSVKIIGGEFEMFLHEVYKLTKMKRGQRIQLEQAFYAGAQASHLHVIDDGLEHSKIIERLVAITKELAEYGEILKARTPESMGFKS